MSKLTKWSGSKDSQAKDIIKYFPKEINSYYEPFLGGGSVFLELLESDVVVNNFYLSDVNAELIGIYRLIKEDPDTLIESYEEHHKEFNSKDIQYRKDYFKKVRDDFNFSKNAADFYFIMRTTTNGMPRYNKAQDFNNSCHFSRPGMNPDEVIKLITKYNKLFNKVGPIINFTNCSYDSNLYYNNRKLNNEDLVYCDPPYENTKGMYFGGFDNQTFIKWLNDSETKWALSYDGKVNEDKVSHIAPNYKRHEYLVSGNSSFRRVIGKSNDSIISESLYLNY